MSEWLGKRIDITDQLLSHVIVNRDAFSVELVLNESSFYDRDSIKGVLSIHPKFVEFGINTGKKWSPNELGDFFKMNRSFFASKAENMALVSQLKYFISEVNQKVEKLASDKGDKTDHFSQTVNSNIPSVFSIKIPIWKGGKAETIEVETVATISGREISLMLIAPDANDLIEQERNTAIDAEIEKIKEIAPDLAIIEV